jgi:hypothetical protein
MRIDAVRKQPMLSHRVAKLTGGRVNEEKRFRLRQQIAGINDKLKYNLQSQETMNRQRQGLNTMRSQLSARMNDRDGFVDDRGPEPSRKFDLEQSYFR